MLKGKHNRGLLKQYLLILCVRLVRMIYFLNIRATITQNVHMSLDLQSIIWQCNHQNRRTLQPGDVGNYIPTPLIYAKLDRNADIKMFTLRGM